MHDLCVRVAEAAELRSLAELYVETRGSSRVATADDATATEYALALLRVVHRVEPEGCLLACQQGRVIGGLVLVSRVYPVLRELLRPCVGLDLLRLRAKRDRGRACTGKSSLGLWERGRLLLVNMEALLRGAAIDYLSVVPSERDGVAARALVAGGLTYLESRGCKRVWCLVEGRARTHAARRLGFAVDRTVQAGGRCYSLVSRRLNSQDPCRACRPAGLARLLIAGAADRVLLLAIALLTGVLFLLGSGRATGLRVSVASVRGYARDLWHLTPEAWYGATFLVTGYLLLYLAYNIASITTLRATPGLLLLRCKIVRVDGGSVDFWTAARRTLAAMGIAWVPGISTYVRMCDYALALGNRRGRMARDMAAGTMVVYAGNRSGTAVHEQRDGDCSH